MRGEPASPEENMFIFTDRTPVLPSQANLMLRTILSKLNMNQSLFSFHSLRSGRATDLLRFGFSIEEIKIKGRWKSNIVYKYIKLI